MRVKEWKEDRRMYMQFHMVWHLHKGLFFSSVKDREQYGKLKTKGQLYFPSLFENCVKFTFRSGRNGNQNFYIF